MNKRLLVPSFLQKLDDRLLRNKPNTWAARTHLVIWFTILFALTLSAFCFLAFFDAKQYSSTGSWTAFVCIIAFIGFVFWMIYLLRFNVFKRYGNWFVWDGLKGFALYFISIGAMVAVCFIPSAVETFRANQQFGNDEIVNDINEINTTACKLEYDLLPLKWSADTFDIIKRPDPVVTYREDEMTTVDTVVSSIVSPAILEVQQNYHPHSVMDTAELRKRIAETDSLIKINDSLYIFYKCPDYEFVSSYNADDHSEKKILRDAGIYYTVLKNYQKPGNRPALLKRMDELKTKYAADNRYSYYEGSDYNNNDGYEAKIKKKYSLIRIGNGIDNAVRKKYAWVDDWNVYLRFFYYTTLLLTLLVFIFRHSTVKTFFLSVLTAVVLMIITGLLMVISNGSESSVFSFIVVYYIIFAGIALSIYGAKVRNAVQGIALNLFLFATPFIPLIFVALNEAIKQRSYYQRGIYQTPEVDNTALYYLIAEIAGSLIFLILLEPLFRKLYRKWFAAPEN